MLRENSMQVLLSILNFYYHILFRTGKFVGQRIPGASLAVMMIEGIVPKSLINWFGVVKTAVIDRSDNCDEEYECTLVDDKV